MCSEFLYDFIIQEITMNQFTFENQGNNAYLVYEIASTDQMDTMSLGMLTNNKIVGLASTIFTQMDSTKYIKYNITSRVSAAEFLSGPVNRKRLLGVFCGIVNGLLAMEDYMIDINSIVLDLDYIFTDVSSCDTVMICLPVVREEIQNLDLAVFFKNIMFNIQFDQTEQDNSYVTDIMNYLNSMPAVALLEFKDLLDNLQRGSGLSGTLPQQASNPAPVSQALVQPMLTSQPISQPVVPKATKQQPQVGQAIAVPVTSPVQNVSPMPAPQPTPNVPPKSSVQAQPVPAAQPMQPVNAKKSGKKDMGIPSQMAIPGAPSQMAIPKAPAGKSEAGIVTGGEKMATEQGNEKKISMFYLLQHYNKENAAAYKAQKAAKKASKGQPQIAMPQQPSQPMGNFMQQPGMNSAQQAIAKPTMNPTPQPAVSPAMNPASRPVVQPTGQSMPGQIQQPTQSVPTSMGSPQSVQQPQINAIQPSSASGTNFGETVVLSAGNMGETSVLSQAAATVENRPHLIRLKNNERINLDKPVFRIGKEKSYVDYFIGDNTAVSRSHANFITRDGEYFVVDTNSTNHTYINGQMIQSNLETKLSHKMRVRLANEDFEFRLY